MAHKEPEFKVSVCFVSPLTSQTNQTEIKAAYKDLARQIAEFAQAVVTDPNILPIHSVVSSDPKDMAPVARITVDPKIAGLQTINKRIEKGESVAVNPKHKNKFETKDDDEDAPHVVARTDWNEARKVEAVATVTPITPAETKESPAPSSDLKAKIMDAVFKKLKKTAKSEAIVGYFLDNIDKEVTVDDIATGSGQDKPGIGPWLSNIGKTIKGITKTGKRGCYMFDSTKVKV